MLSHVGEAFMANSSIERGLSAYNKWRNALTASIVSLQHWLDRESLIDQTHKDKLTQILGYVDDDNLYISFVSEYSRGKTELINTLFFSQYGKRVLPSGLGRTTMCPTEIFYNAEQPLRLSLLPIETNSSDRPLSELKVNFKDWVHFSVDTNDPDEIINAFKHLQDVIKVPPKIAKSLGFTSNVENSDQVNDDNLVEIPKWRHALVNIKHPLLEQKLVILDTPGLNAIGTEANLTINQLPRSHSIVFVLDNSAGVTKSDLDLWSQHIKMENNASRIIALNKIDTLWDSTKTGKEIDTEIQSQVSLTAERLNINPDNIFPVSAKAGLIGKFQKRSSMVKKSRIAAFEKALVYNLIPSKKKIVLSNIFPLAQSLAKNIDEVLNKRSNTLKQQEAEIKNTLNKNDNVINQIQDSLSNDSGFLLRLSEQNSFINSSFAEPIKELRLLLDIGSLEQQKAKFKAEFKAEKSVINKRRALLLYLRQTNQKMRSAVIRAAEIEERSKDIRNSNEFNNNDVSVVFRRLELDRHLSMLNSIEQSFLDLEIGNKLSHKKQVSRLKKAFDNCSLSISRTFKRALNETNDWRRTLIAPLETRVRNQSKQLSERKNSIEKLVHSNKKLKVQLKTNLAEKEIIIKQKTQLYALVHNVNKHLIHSSYTEEDLYKPTTSRPSNVVKMKPNAS